MPLLFTRRTRRKPPTAKAEDRRAAHRYGVKMALRYRAAGSPPNSAWKHGHTLDMSAGGVRIAIPETKLAGAKLELVVDFPGLYHDKPLVHLFLVGSVERTDGRSVALRILRHRFCDIPEVAAGSQLQRGNRAVA